MERILNLQTEDKEISVPAETEILILDRPALGQLSESRVFQVENGAKVQYVLIVDEHDASPRDVDEADGQLRREWKIGADAAVAAYYVFLGGGRSEWHLTHHIGERARIESRSLFLGQATDGLEVKADYDFDGRKSFGRVQIDALLTAAAHLRYDANLNVHPSAQLSDTRVDMRLRLDGSQARGRIVPALNIAANDVKAGHSASTYQLSTDDLFYLRSRGLEPDAIRRLLAISLSRNFIIGLSDAQIAAEILALIESRL